MVEGKHTVIQKDRTKNKTSHRSLPLVVPFEALLLDMKRQQKENQILCGNCYNTDYLDYIYVDPIGNLIKPDYITGHFQLVLKIETAFRFREDKSVCNYKRHIDAYKLDRKRKDLL